MTTDLATVAERLPDGLIVRVQDDADVERIVEFRNRWATPSEWMAPAAARQMRAASPEPLRLGLVVEDARGGIQAVGNTGNGGPFAPADGSWRLALFVAPEWRRRGVARALLGRLEEHARGNGAKRLVASARANVPAGARFAEAMGYRAYHERVDAYLDVAAFDESKFEDPDAIAGRAGARRSSRTRRSCAARRPRSRPSSARCSRRSGRWRATCRRRRRCPSSRRRSSRRSG